MWYRAGVRGCVLATVLCLFSARALAGDALSSGDPSVRARAARQAGEQGLTEAGPRLRQLLADPHWQVRAESARALGRLNIVDAKRELMVRAQTDFSAQVRAAAAEAVRRLDPAGFASVLGTADLPPVRPAPARPAPRPAPPERAVLTTLALVANVLRIDETVAGQAGVGLRWPHADVQLGLSFPALTLSGQVRWNILPRARLVPYLTAGAALAYNNTQSELGSAGSVFGGAGLRAHLLPRSRPGGFGRRIYFYLEVLANRVLSQRRPANQTLEPRTFSLPVLAGVGAELWP